MKLFISFFLSLTFLLADAVGTSSVDLSGFSSLLILDEGRVKPLDTFARGKLLQISSRSSLGSEPAISWLARVIFAPELAFDDKVFRINHPDLLSALGLSEETRHRYSFHQLEPSISTLQGLYEKSSHMEENEKSALDKEVARVMMNLNTYAELMQAVRFQSPHPAFKIDNAQLLQSLHLSELGKTYSFLEIRSHSADLQKILLPLSSRKPSTELELAAIEISRKLKLFDDFYSGIRFPIIPISNVDANGKNSLTWISPWSIATKNLNQVELSRIDPLSTMASAYIAQDSKAFARACKQFQEMNSVFAKELPSAFKQKLEVSYNQFDPFYIAELFYGFALLFVFVSFLFLEKKLGAVLSSLSGLLVFFGFVVHFLGIVTRMILTGRPPITNLYETFLFVSAVTVFLSFFLERFNRRGLGWLSASLTGLVLLMISGRFAAEGDTLRVLVAVLDSNFWLSTHVIAINLGYAGTVLSGVIGHIYLVMSLFKNANEKKLSETAKLVYGVQGFGLLFTFVGTMLGGVWADQSWGRFWGWDPKENGALLIVLWSSILFHARMAGMIRNFGFAVGSVLGIIVVMMAWFGINLLGVGLHSYGFTSGIAYTLFSYVGIQLIVLGFLVFAFRFKNDILVNKG
jgi:ABC-type transport system involved in cytochrome c biogenesis permease subunit